MITYTNSREKVSAHQLQGFFKDWENVPSPQIHLRILKNSSHVVLAVDEKTNKVVGFITAITDETLSAHVPFLEVLESYQGKGIGTELVRKMLKQLEHFYMVDVVCDPELEPFYACFGLRRSHAMVKRDFSRQSGAGSG